MDDAWHLIPDPAKIRIQLARNIRERHLLRALLKLAIRAANDYEDLRYMANPDQDCSHRLDLIASERAGAPDR